MFSFLTRYRPSLPLRIRHVISPLVNQLFEIEDIKVSKEGAAIVVLRPVNPVAEIEIARHKIERVVLGVKGITKAIVVLTGQRPVSPPLPVHQSKGTPSRSSQITGQITGLPPVVIAVTSGKGGVGKSTIAVNLAIALSQSGQKVGILDADIYGPSVPRLLGIQDQKADQDDDGRLNPVKAHGLKAMSMGFMVDEKTAMIWRGPMVQSALIQMLRDVNWDGLDILVIDMPPGTGDIHLTLAQRVPLSGGVVVSTPQDIALIDARKGLEMFRKVEVPILGIVENMSYYCCPECGHRDDVFGHGGARAEAVQLGIPFLGEIPLHGLIRIMSDSGTPVTISAPESEQSKSFQTIAANILSGLQALQRPPPTIQIED